MPSASHPPPPNRASKISNVTLQDVARVAGVFKITASRALANPDVVSTETRKRVEEAVLQTGYVRNFLAGSLKSNRTKLIACLVPTIGSGSVFMDTVQAMTEVLKVASYQVQLGQRGYNVAEEEQLIEALLARRPDGLVLMGALRSGAARKRLRSTGTPTVEAWDISGEPVNTMIGFSHRKAGAEKARYLHAKGRRHPGIISADEPRGTQRAQGFIEAVRRLGTVAKGVEVPSWK